MIRNRLIRAVTKFVVRSIAIAWFYTLIWPSPAICPDLTIRADLYAPLAELNETINYIKTQTNPLFRLSNADVIGVFLADDDLFNTYRITYTFDNRLEIVKEITYPVLDDVQREFYQRSFTEGCVWEKVNDFPESDWAQSLSTFGIDSGIVCSLKRQNRRDRNLQGILVFEYRGSEPPSSMQTFTTSIDRYRTRIASAVLDFHEDHSTELNLDTFEYELEKINDNQL